MSPRRRLRPSNDEPDADEWARTLPDSYLLCRDMGHIWRPYTARIVEGGRGYERTMRCSRCRTERQQMLSASGVVLSGHYSYQDGYKAPSSVGFLSHDARSGLRLESTLRLISKDGD